MSIWVKPSRNIAFRFGPVASYKIFHNATVSLIWTENQVSLGADETLMTMRWFEYTATKKVGIQFYTAFFVHIPPIYQKFWRALCIL